jgi:hypothetical protein
MSLPEGKRLSGMKIARDAAHKDFVDKRKAEERAARTKGGQRIINVRAYQRVAEEKSRSAAERLADENRTGGTLVSVQRTKDGWGVYACTA